jgi:hypothetical protein
MLFRKLTQALLLNNVLKNSLYKTTIEISNKGVVSRKDNNGNTFVYNLNDVANIKYVQDGFHNTMITLKKGKKIAGFVEGKNVESNMNVIAFRTKANCDKAIEIFNNLIKTKSSNE